MALGFLLNVAIVLLTLIVILMLISCTASIFFFIFIEDEIDTDICNKIILETLFLSIIAIYLGS